MKTIIKFTVMATLVFVILVSSNNAFGNNLSFTNDRLSLTMAFYKTDTVLVVTPDNFGLTNSDIMEIESYTNFTSGRSKPNYKFMKESDLKPEDNKKHILVYGSFKDFTKKELLNIPVKKTLDGFKFKNKTFCEPTDAFYYINARANKLYVCKNSKLSGINIFTMGVGAFPLHVFRGTEIVYTGIIVK